MENCDGVAVALHRISKSSKTTTVMVDVALPTYTRVSASKVHRYMPTITQSSTRRYIAVHPYTTGLDYTRPKADRHRLEERVKLLMLSKRINY
jgi:hypothetical protein